MLYEFSIPGILPLGLAMNAIALALIFRTVFEVESRDGGDEQGAFTTGIIGAAFIELLALLGFVLSVLSATKNKANISQIYTPEMAALGFGIKAIALAMVFKSCLNAMNRRRDRASSFLVWVVVMSALIELLGLLDFVACILFAMK